MTKEEITKEIQELVGESLNDFMAVAIKFSNKRQRLEQKLKEGEDEKKVPKK